jgi:hypothetical protein
VLCVVGALEMLTILAKEALFAGGHAERGNALTVALVSLQVSGLLLAVPFGLSGAAWGLLIAGALGFVVTQQFLARTIGLTSRELLRHCAGSAVLTASAALPALIVTYVFPIGEHNFVLVFLGVVGLSSACWLITARTIQHPLWAELTSGLALVSKRFKRHGTA